MAESKLISGAPADGPNMFGEVTATRVAVTALAGVTTLTWSPIS